MSEKAMIWAWNQDLNTLTKMVLLTLCNYANDRNESRHSYESIAKASGMSRRSVIRHTRFLEEQGYINITNRRLDRDQHLTNEFRINLKY